VVLAASASVARIESFVPRAYGLDIASDGRVSCMSHSADLHHNRFHGVCQHARPSLIACNSS
jgi:hypothetical protein